MQGYQVLDAPEINVEELSLMIADAEGLVVTTRIPVNKQLLSAYG